MSDCVAIPAMLVVNALICITGFCVLGLIASFVFKHPQASILRILYITIPVIAWVIARMGIVDASQCSSIIGG
jgi:hypothetical protein